MTKAEAIPEEKSADYFSQIPVWKSGKRCFEVMADGLSGCIPVTRLGSSRDCTELLESPFFNLMRRRWRQGVLL